VSREPNSRAARVQLATANEKLGNLALYARELDRAETFLHRAAEILQPLARDEPRGGKSDLALCRVTYKIGDAALVRGERRRARVLHQEALAFVELDPPATATAGERADRR